MNIKHLRVKAVSKFRIPLQSEVSEYIKQKKNWPQKFCDYYAERFWNFYNSNGWKVSGRAAMKSWESAFCSNWQDLKFKNDIDFLNKCISDDPKIPSVKKESALLNWWLTQYTKLWDKITDLQFAAWYDYMKERHLIKMTDLEKQKAIDYAQGNKIKGKALCVRIIFDRMINNNECFR